MTHNLQYCTVRVCLGNVSRVRCSSSSETPAIVKVQLPWDITIIFPRLRVCQMQLFHWTLPETWMQNDNQSERSYIKCSEVIIEA